MSTTPKLKPSDLVIWRDSHDGQIRRLTKLGTATTWEDRQTGKRFNTQQYNFLCKIVFLGDDPLGHLDPTNKLWELTTQGQDKGSRRYRRYLTQANAEEMALAWLDRRFKVVEYR